MELVHSFSFFHQRDSSTWLLVLPLRILQTCPTNTSTCPTSKIQLSKPPVNAGISMFLIFVIYRLRRRRGTLCIKFLGKEVTNEEINQFFFENILKEDFLGCSITAFTYLKERHHFRPLIVPYLLTQNKKKYSLILDLDETLIHFKVNHNENDEGVLKLRPGVFTFLEKVGEFYEIILFSEASEEYTILMMEAFKNNNNKKYFDYKLYRKHCIIIGQEFIKDLSRIGRPLDKTIIIDNLAQNFKMQKNNGIVIKPFLGEDHNDQALIDLIPILVNIARDEIDVRNGLMKYRDEILTKISSNLFRRNKQNNN